MNKNMIYTIILINGYQTDVLLYGTSIRKLEKMWLEALSTPSAIFRLDGQIFDAKQIAMIKEVN